MNSKPGRTEMKVEPNKGEDQFGVLSGTSELAYLRSMRSCGDNLVSPRGLKPPSPSRSIHAGGRWPFDPLIWRWWRQRNTLTQSRAQHLCRPEDVQLIISPCWRRGPTTGAARSYRAFCDLPMWWTFRVPCSCNFIRKGQRCLGEDDRQEVWMERPRW